MTLATHIFYSFYLRRIHSLIGVLPLGAFLVEHFFTNSFAMFGAQVYNSKVEFFMGLPYILLVEILFIWIPVLFHGILGCYIACTGQLNVTRYGFNRNWMYLMQRLTGFVAFAFIFYHVYATRISGLLTGRHATFESVSHSLDSPFILVFYVVGILCASYHLGNGLFGFLITWGISIGNKTQRGLSVLCVMLSVGMAVFGLAALRFFV